MKEVDIKKAQSMFAELLSELDSGNSIVITEEGVPKAILSKYLNKTQDSSWNKYGKYMDKIPFGNNFDDDEDISSLF